MAEKGFSLGEINAMAVEAMGNPEEHAARISAVSELFKSISRGEMDPALARIAHVNPDQEWVNIANITNAPREDDELEQIIVAISPKNPNSIQVQWIAKFGAATTCEYRLQDLSKQRRNEPGRAALMKSLVGAVDQNSSEFYGFALVKDGYVPLETKLPFKTGDIDSNVMDAPNSFEEQLYLFRTETSLLTQDVVKNGIIEAMKIPPKSPVTATT